MTLALLLTIPAWSSDAGEPSAQGPVDAWGFAPMDTAGLSYAESEHFRVWYTPEADKGAQAMLAQAEAVRARLWKQLDLKETGAIRVVLVPAFSEYFKRRGQPNRAPDWAVGLCISSEDTVLVKWGRQADGRWVALEPTFVHELAHLALDRATDDSAFHADGELRNESRAQGHRRVPRWLHEGYAVRTAGEWTLERGAVLMQAGLRGRIIPLAQLRNRFPAEGFQVELAYAQSFHFVRFLQDEYGHRAFANMLGFIRTGEEFETAFFHAYGRRFGPVEATWRKELNVAYTWIPVITGSSTVWFAAGITFLFAWWRKRKQAAERMAQLALEEQYEAAHAGPPVHLPGLGLTHADTRPRPWRVLADGTWVRNEDWRPPETH